jgi:hypothetical protein
MPVADQFAILQGKKSSEAYYGGYSSQMTAVCGMKK